MKNSLAVRQNPTLVMLTPRAGRHNHCYLVTERCELKLYMLSDIFTQLKRETESACPNMERDEIYSGRSGNYHFAARRAQQQSGRYSYEIIAYISVGKPSLTVLEQALTDFNSRVHSIDWEREVKGGIVIDPVLAEVEQRLLVQESKPSAKLTLKLVNPDKLFEAEPTSHGKRSKLVPLLLTGLLFAGLAYNQLAQSTKVKARNESKSNGTGIPRENKPDDPQKTVSNLSNKGLQGKILGPQSNEKTKEKKTVDKKSFEVRWKEYLNELKESGEDLNYTKEIHSDLEKEDQLGYKSLLLWNDQQAHRKLTSCKEASDIVQNVLISLLNWSRNIRKTTQPKVNVEIDISQYSQWLANELYSKYEFTKKELKIIFDKLKDKIKKSKYEFERTCKENNVNNRLYRNKVYYKFKSGSQGGVCIDKKISHPICNIRF